MAHTHSFNTSHHSLMSGIGNKVKQVAEIAGTLKGLYDTGKIIYQAVSPFVGPVVAGLL